MSVTILKWEAWKDYRRMTLAHIDIIFKMIIVAGLLVLSAWTGPNPGITTHARASAEWSKLPVNPIDDPSLGPGGRAEAASSYPSDSALIRQNGSSL